VRPWSDSEPLAVAEAERRRATEGEGDVPDVESSEDRRVQGLCQRVAPGGEPEVARQAEQQECMPVVKTEHEVLVQALHEVAVCSQETTSEEVDVLAAETEHLTGVGTAVGRHVHTRVHTRMSHAEHGLINHRGRVAEEAEPSDTVDRGERATRDRDAREERQTGRTAELEGRGEHGRDGEGTSGGVAQVEVVLQRVAGEAGHDEAADRAAHRRRGEADAQTDLAQGGLNVGGQRRGEVETGTEGDHGLELHEMLAGPVPSLAEEATHLASAHGAAAGDGAAGGASAATALLALATGGRLARWGAAATGRRLAPGGPAASGGLAATGRRLAPGGPAASGGLAATGGRLARWGATATGGRLAPRGGAPLGRSLAPRGGAPLGRSLAPRRRATCGRLAAAGGRLAARGGAPRRRLAARGRATSGDLSSGHALHFPFCCSTPLRAHGIHDNEFLKSHRRRLNALHRLPVYEENEATCCRI
jgi:hypothetical protein